MEHQTIRWQISPYTSSLWLPCIASSYSYRPKQVICCLCTRNVVNRIIVLCRSTHLTYTFHITKFCMHITSTCSWSRSLFNEKIDLTLTATNSRAAMIFQRCIYEDPVRTRKLLLGGNQISPLWYMKITRERKKGKLHIYPVNYI